MINAVLTRYYTSDEGTVGNFESPGFHCFTIELPWRGNRKGQSCIPAGSYICNWRYSAKHGLCYHVEDVPGRTDIEIHAANWAGDSSKGLKVQLLGCLAPGRQIGTLEGQTAALNSRDALDGLEDALKREPFLLTVLWKEGDSPEAQNAEQTKSAD